MWQSISPTGEDQQAYNVSAASDQPFSKNVAFSLRRAHVCSWASTLEEEHYQPAFVHASDLWRTYTILFVCRQFLFISHHSSEVFGELQQRRRQGTFEQEETQSLSGGRVLHLSGRRALLYGEQQRGHTPVIGAKQEGTLLQYLMDLEAII